MTKIKICGITCIEDAMAAVELGADAIGFIFAESPRRIEPEQARAIARALPTGIQTVGVFVNAPMWRIAEFDWLWAVQLHGSETPEYARALPRSYMIKAFRIRDEQDLEALADYIYTADAFLLDTFVKGIAGGTGRKFNWDLAIQAKRYGKPIILAGGLNPDNAAEAVARVAPDWLDISSGVEASPGRKDHHKIKEFIDNVRQADQRTR